jgi:hypothetical protein
MMIIVATLKNENQNSSSPNTFTLIRLTAQIISTRYAQENLGGLAGYITGWTYCFEILIVAIADVTAFGIYMGQRAHNDIPRHAADNVCQQYARPRHFNGVCRTIEQAGTNSGTKGHKANVPGT